MDPVPSLGPVQSLAAVVGRALDAEVRSSWVVRGGDVAQAEATTAAGRTVLTSAEGWTLTLSDRNARKVGNASSKKVVLGARHSAIRLHKAQVDASVPAKIYTVEPTGDVTFVQVFLSGAVVNISLPPTFEVEPDEQVWLEFDQERMHLFDGSTELAAAAPTTPAAPAQTPVEVSPDATGMPGAELLQQALGWLSQLALWGSLASILIGAAVYGISQNGANYNQAFRGKQLAAAGAIGAVLTGLAPTAVNMLFGAAS